MSATAPIRIRRATADDAPELSQLRWEFRSGTGASPQEPAHRFLPRCRLWMRRALSSRVWHAWVALLDGEVVGCIWAQIVDKVPNPIDEPERHAYLSNLFVRPRARGGTGGLLVSRCLAWVEHRAVDEVLLWPTAPSRSLYRRNGFARGELVWSRREPRPTPAAARRRARARPVPIPKERQR